MHTYRIDSLGKTWCGGVRNSCILPMNLQSRRNRIRRRRTANGVSGGSALQLWDKPLSFGFRRSPGLTIKCRDVPNGVQRDQELQDRSVVNQSHQALPLNQTPLADIRCILSSCIVGVILCMLPVIFPL